jgi:hypothetical protein
MSNELNRFLDLYGTVVAATNDWIKATPPEVLDWIPDEGPGNLFTDARGKLSIRLFYVHLVSSDHKQAPQLWSCDEGATIVPSDRELADKLMASDDLVGDAARLHEQDMADFGKITDTQMEKTVLRGDHQWTIAGYLWSIYSHRAFHVGNMDIYLRERHVVPPNYYPAIMR